MSSKEKTISVDVPRHFVDEHTEVSGGIHHVPESTARRWKADKKATILGAPDETVQAAKEQAKIEAVKEPGAMPKG